MTSEPIVGATEGYKIGDKNFAVDEEPLFPNRKFISKSGAIDDFGPYARRVIESLERSLRFVKRQALKAHGTPESAGDRSRDRE